MNDLNKRARICKESMEEFILLLQKEYLPLKDQDLLKANILARIAFFKPILLEEVFQQLYYYEIDLILKEKTKKAGAKVLEYYDRPNWVIRGRDVFEEIYDDLIVTYGIGKSGDSEK